MSAIPFPGAAPTTPPVPEKTFPHAYVTQLVINARSNGDQDTLYCEVCPYNQETGEMLPQQAIEVRTPLWAAVAAVPELQTAMGAILAAVAPTVAYANQPEPEPEA